MAEPQRIADVEQPTESGLLHHGIQLRRVTAPQTIAGISQSLDSDNARDDDKKHHDTILDRRRALFFPAKSQPVVHVTIQPQEYSSSEYNLPSLANVGYKWQVVKNKIWGLCRIESTVQQITLADLSNQNYLARPNGIR